MSNDKISMTKVRRVEPKEKTSSSPLDGPYFRYLDEHDGDRELEKYNGKPCSIVKKFELDVYGEMYTIRFADGLETDVLACDILF